jgi:hypothetical protein
MVDKKEFKVTDNDNKIKEAIMARDDFVVQS